MILKMLMGLIGKLALKSVIKICGMKVIREFFHEIVFPKLDELAKDDQPDTKDFNDILVEQIKKGIDMALDNLEK